NHLSSPFCCFYLVYMPKCTEILLVGPSRCSGRVEVFYQDSWGTVCDDEWSIANAEVVCRELNCGTAMEAKNDAFFGRGKDEIWLDDVQCCTGHEMFLADCPHKGFGVYDCNHSEYAGLVCSGNTGCILIRLINGTDSCSGRVEVFHDGRWGKLCSNNWGLKEAAVLCKELNCGDPKNSKDIFYFGDSSLQGFTSRCSDNVNSISQCQLQEHRGSCEGVSLVCSGALSTIRFRPSHSLSPLTGGSTHCDGRVEYFNKGQWGTVCAESWDMNDATVVCRQLDCGKPHKLIQLGPGTGNIWTDQIECNGEESTLTQCFTRATCGHEYDAGVLCAGKPPIRLVNGIDRCSGRVEILHDGRWGTVCDDDWDFREAEVVCRAMDCGTPQRAKSNAFFGEGQGVIWYSSVNCLGNETSLGHCRYRPSGRFSCRHREDAGVICSGKNYFVIKYCMTCRRIRTAPQSTAHHNLYHSYFHDISENIVWISINAIFRHQLIADFVLFAL
uniref:Soluble scavenger receptor cysteine-rich domain-containing protein SSC5D n=1 Tax=Pundamilia nyererei TaxID=303518 RepID=A0A3B4FF69_9CICH